MEILKSSTIKDTPFGTMSVDAGTLICKPGGNNFRLRQKRSYGNSFGPYFYGKLLPTQTGTEISGEFRIHPFAFAFMAVWFGGVILIGGMMAFASLTQLISGHHHSKNANPLVGIIMPVVMVAFGIALVKFGKWLGKSEEAKMTSFLQQAFSTNKTPALTASSTPMPPGKISITGPILFFAGLGILSLVASFTGISSFQAAASSQDHSGAVITYFRDQWGRGLALANGIFLCCMAYGIWKRVPLVWKLGFALIALSGVSFVFNVLGDPNAFPRGPGKFPLVLMVFVIAGASVVSAFWAVWWYKKKAYFTR